ncbi:neurexin-4 [Lepeophtheirus salmonis]|uniref:Neurexin-4 n=1 Tax=Lepeophtheirus salmonis TaxID=72036 RepID=A0A0K2TN71_LEPSM|nr:neurexin-4-like [Lepeophtheirus salmonis]
MYYSCLFLVISWVATVHAQYVQTYASQSDARYALDSPYNLCREPQLATSSLHATSKASNRGVDNARLWSGTSWTAENSDFHQALTVDLGKIKNITGIATQGRAHSEDYVMEYQILYGTNGKDFSDYKDIDGSPKLFRGNSDGDFVVRNDFDQPIIASWIQINPTRWADRISMRLELYGCEYIPDVLFFNGTALIQRDLSTHPIASLRDTFRLRFKTNEENGIILYSRGSQGDYLALQLVENRLLLNMRLGKDIEETSMSLGSLLDNNVFHEVMVSRDRRDVILSVDRVKIRDRLNGDYMKLNLDRQIYIGGVPHVEEGLVVFENFTGCIENMYLNHSNVIAGFKEGYIYDREYYRYEDIGGVTKGCPKNYYTIPVTFKNAKSSVRLTGYEGSEKMNVSLEFRTYEGSGLLFYHRFSSEGFVKLFLEDARVKVVIVSENMPEVEIDNFDQTFNDGNWHSVELALAKDKAVLSIDQNPMTTVRLLSISTGSYYIFGGGIYGEAGFIGCMKQITIDGNYRLPSAWKPEEYSSLEDIVLESCRVVDRCTPNPCEHGGVCKQNSEEFFCECEDTGYTGAVCHISLNFKSCVDYKNDHPESRYADTIIDIDSSGPLPPFEVRCEFFPDGRNVTYVGHKNEDATKVDGFEGHGTYVQNIFYDTTMANMEALINRSNTCLQRLAYDCKRSRLLDASTGDSDKFDPFGWWVSRQNKKMDYWAGSLPGSRKCECGLSGTCFSPEKWCNCDSGHDDWEQDAGDITQKEYLPVRALHFGDTGTPLDRKEGRYSLGPLECEGDELFDNIITFRKDDAVIALPTFEMGLSGDIFFQFKTTSTKTMVLIHSTGETGDYIKISLISGNHVQFEYEAGKGQQGVTVETSYRLDDDKWHSVLIERNRKEAMVVVDGARKGQAKEPSGPVRSMRLTSKLYVGSTLDFADGFVGCMRALILNGVSVDLIGEATRNPWGLYGIGIGCTGKCNSEPCLNGGECVEGYDHFTCDCRWTPFKGPICADEIGVNMRSDYMIKYDFKGNYKSTIAEKIHVGFTTTDPSGFLIGAYSDISKEYLTLMVSNSGHIRLVFDFGFERQEIVYTEQNFLTGQYHDVRIERFDQGRQIKLTVDNYMPKIVSFEDSLKSSADAQFNNIRYLYIGRNESMREGFVGCISRVEFDEIIPLKLLFQEDPLSNIQSFPEAINEDFCGIEPVTLRPEEDETRKPPEIDEDKIQHLYQTFDSAILGAVLTLIFLGLVIFAVLLGKYVNRYKGAYLTREDEGAHDAFDADTAVLQGRTGHQVEKKKEWFI